MTVERITKKLAGHSKETALWVSSVGNELGQILNSVLTGQEGPGLDRMAAGLMERYRQAGVAPPMVLCVDCGCCITEGLSKLQARFGEWPDLHIRLDIWHFMRRLAVGCTTDAHPLYPAFMRALSSCIFEWDAGDLDLLQRSKTKQLQQEQRPGITRSMVDSQITKKELSTFCRRRTRGEEATLVQIERLLEELRGPKGRDLMGVPLLDEVRMDHIWRVQKRHIKCIQDVPGIQLYTEVGSMNKSGIKLTSYRCARGSTSLESFHCHLNRFIPGTSTNLLNFQLYLLEGLNRWNQDWGTAAVSGKPSCLLTYAGDINNNSLKVLGREYVPNFTPPAKYTGPPHYRKCIFWESVSNGKALCSGRESPYVLKKIQGHWSRRKAKRYGLTVSQTSGSVPFHGTVTGKQLRAINRLQNLKRHHDQCEERYDYAKLKILKRERQRTLSLSTRMNDSVGHAADEDDDGSHDGDYSSFNDQISDSEFSDNTDYEDVDYVPDSCGNSSDTSVHSKQLRVTDNSPKKLLDDISLVMATAHSVEITGSHSSSVISCSADSTEGMLHNNSAIKVTALPKRGRKSKYNKKQYCLYCKKNISKLARHLESAHSNQPDVAMAFSFAKGSHKRRELLRCLKKRGNFQHNASVAVQGAGAFVACRRPTKEKQSDDYRHCKFCQGLYARESLWRHARRCPQKPVEGDSPTGRKRIQLDLPKPDQVHETVWKIACEMNQDDISLVVRSERDILRLGESLYNCRKPHERRNDYIRQKMREIARLLIEARAKTPLKSTEDLVIPSNFPQVIQAVRAVAGYDLESNSYKVPSLALKLGHSLAKLAGIVQCTAIIAHRCDVAESAKQFATLY